jgi:hypothetical protein
LGDGMSVSEGAVSWTDDDLIGLRIKGTPSDRNRTLSRGDRLPQVDQPDPRVLRNVVTPAPAKKRGKYRAEPTEVDGHRFPSKREAERYRVLKAQLAAGEIWELELQPRYVLRVMNFETSIIHVVGEYIADFKYRRHGGIEVIEDAKGMKLPLYLLKKKIAEAQYGIRIQEV